VKGQCYANFIRNFACLGKFQSASRLYAKFRIENQAVCRKKLEKTRCTIFARVVIEKTLQIPKKLIDILNHNDDD
jgi:hypothetical protein